MKRLEDTTEEELREFAKLAFQTCINQIISTTPFYNVSNDILNQLTNYNSRN